MTTEERLKQYIDNDEVYQDYKNGNINLTDFEKFCIQHCKDIEEILEENQKYKELIDKAIKYYESNQQECVIGRNKDEKLIKEYYLPAQCSKKMLDILKEVE